jgi:NTP pyrophosphatase (non-canonical NTP hydrolase)
VIQVESPLDFEQLQKMNLSDMQEKVDEYISQFKEGYFSPMTQVVRLTEEVGELAREVNHAHGELKKKNNDTSIHIEEELTDVLFVTILIANSLGIDLTETFKKDMAKFEKRDRFRFERKDGLTHD